MESRSHLLQYFMCKKMFIKNICFNILILFLTGCFNLCYAQDSLKVYGYVVDEETNYPLSSIYLTINGVSVGTTTDFEGYFEFRASVVDSVCISFIGYKAEVHSVRELVGDTVLMKVEDSILDCDVAYVYSPISIGYIGNFEERNGITFRIPFVGLLNKFVFWPSKIWRGGLSLNYMSNNEDNFSLLLEAKRNKLFSYGRVYSLSFDLAWHKRRFDFDNIPEFNINDYKLKFNNATNYVTVILGLNRRDELYETKYGGILGVWKYIRKINTFFNAEALCYSGNSEYHFSIDHHIKYLLKGMHLGCNYNYYSQYNEFNFTVKYNYMVCIGID